MLVIKRKKQNNNKGEDEYIPAAVYKEIISEEEVKLTYREELDPKIR